MKKWMIGVAALGLLAQAQPAEAGGRVRRAARTTAIVAAATSTTAVVAAAPRRTTVVAAAGARTTVVAAAVAPRAVVAALPDLTVTEVVATGDALCVVITNIGTAPSPPTRAQIDLLRPLDSTFLAGHTARVPALLVNQSVRIRLRSTPVSGIKAGAFVDPRREAAELDEMNNELTVALPAAAPESAPPVLDVEEGWGPTLAE